jgi:hypothetical protein
MPGALSGFQQAEAAGMGQGGRTRGLGDPSRILWTYGAGTGTRREKRERRKGKISRQGASNIR